MSRTWLARLTALILALAVLSGGCTTRLSVELESPADPGRVEASAPIRLRFSRPMDPASSERPLEFEPRVAGNFEWEDNDHVLVFTPSRPLAAGRTYRIDLDRDLRSESGLAFEAEQSWELVVPVPPQVAHRREEPLGTAGRRFRYVLEFNHPMDRASVEQALSVEPEIPLLLDWRGEALVVEPVQPLEPGQRYSFRLGTAARDLEGGSLATEYRWSRTMPRLLLNASLPYASRPDSEIALFFNYPLDEEGVRAAFTLEPEVEGSLRLSDEGDELSFTPAADWPFSTHFTARLAEGLADADGDPLAPPDPIEFTTWDAILSHLPASYEQVEPGAVIEVTFARLMDPGSTEAAFTIEPFEAGEFEWSGRTMLFRPTDGYLEPETSYTVSLGAEAVDSEGAPVLRAAFRWSFETTEMPRAASFWSIPSVMVLTPGEEASLPIEVFEGEFPAVSLYLYEIDEEEFTYRYSRQFTGAWDYDREVIPAEGLTLVADWDLGELGCENSWGCAEEVEVPGDLATGFYLLSLETTRPEDQVLLVVARDLITAKSSSGQVLAWVTDRHGEPIPEAEVRVYLDNGFLAAEGLTDDDGLYEIWLSPQPRPALVIASVGEHVSVAGLSGSWTTMSPYSCWGWWSEGFFRPSVEASGNLAHVHTDRPIYRPGQTVYFKVILREDLDALIRLPDEGTEMTVRILDARENVLQTLELATNDFGTAHDSFQLAEGAVLGDYQIEVRVGDDSFRQAFKVEEYRRPDYRVTVTPEQARYLAGENIQVTVEAEYYMGRPVSDAQVTVRTYSMADPGEYWYYTVPAAELIESDRSARGSTDASGQFTLSLDAPFGSYYFYPVEWTSSLERMRLGIEVSVDDGTGQSVAGIAVVEVYAAAESIRLDTAGYYHAFGETVPIRIEVTDLDGAPVAGRQLSFELSRYNAHDWRTTVVETDELTTDAQGTASLELTPSRSGWYALAVSSADAFGHELWDRSWVYVPGPGQARYTGGELRIQADRESYAPGDTARLVIESDFSGTALLTFERGTVHRPQLITLTAPLTTLEVPIRPDDVPNIYAVVTAWGPPTPYELDMDRAGLPDRISRVARVELTVPAVGRTLQVEITPDRDTYAPRDTAVFHLQVTDSNGRPVQAELSLALVDESIFALSEDLTPALLDAFYGRRQRRVGTYDTLSIRKYLYPGECGGGGGGGPAFANPRSDFPDTAVWIPVIVTDANGEAEIEVRLPDSLTTWRLTARAVTRDSKVGEATETILTQQAVVIRPTLPRSLTVGDSATLTASVRNDSGSSQSIRVALESEALDIVSDASMILLVGSGEERSVSWEVLAVEPGDAELTFTAEGTSAQDAVRLALPVHEMEVRQVETHAGVLEGSRSFTIDRPGGALPSGGVRVELSRSVAAGLLDGLEFLTGFPYGCVEQTMSAALPDAVIGRAFRLLGAGDPAFYADLEAKIRAGVQRLYGFQHDDGGWGWWFDDRSEEYQTAWVIFGLAVTRDAGYEVDPEVIERGANWLNDHLQDMDPRTRAFALYSLATAGYGEVIDALGLMDSLEELDPFAQAALALALHDLGAEDRALEILDVLAGDAVSDEEGVHWGVPEWDGTHNRKTMASDVRTTALALSAFVQIESPHRRLTEGMARWLMSRRDAHGWGTTNETAFAILGLTDQLLASEALEEPSAYRIELDGEALASGSLGPDQPTVTVEIPAEEFGAGEHVIQIEQEGEVALYFVVSSDFRLAQSSLEAEGRIEVEREYLDPETGETVDQVRPGDLIRVQLTVTLPEDGSYMIIEDRLPGGLEALNERLNTTSRVALEEEYVVDELWGFWWEDYGYNYKEIRGDRVSFFVSELGEGEHIFDYYVRATHPGIFAVLPAEAWAMYDLTLWGRSSSSEVEIERAE